MSLDILFVHPGNQKRIYQELSKEFTAIAPPAWTSLLANNVRNEGYAAAIYDVNVDGWDNNVPKELIQKYQPRLIVIMVYGHNPSASTQTMPAAGNIAKDIKTCNKDIPVAMGGIHPSALPRRTLCEEDVDFVIQGEGVHTINGLIKYLKGKCKVEEVPGLWYRKDIAIQFSYPAPLVDDLDKVLDGYAWDLLPDLNRYRAHNMHCFQYFNESRTEDFSDVRMPYMAMNTSLGCPYSCHYCCINAIFDKPGIRYWSVEKVLSWIDILVGKYSIRTIRFDDELFILSPKRVERFCDMVIERGYDLNFWVYGRVDTVKDNLLKKMKRAGINWICLGIESANERVRKGVNKEIKRDIKDVVRQIQANDIYVLGNYMFGLPEDDIDTMQETSDLAMDLNCEFVNFYTVMAFPGSALYNEVLSQQGKIAYGWESFSQHSFNTQPMPTRFLSPAKVLTFRDKTFNIYNSNEKYLSMIDEKFGKKVRGHIERMLAIKIKRRLISDTEKVSGAIER
jgi:radical SAM superfamily enzyme YgiQ (UPF0313 family)